MQVLLVSTYELGRQPVHLASPAAALRSRGHQVRCLDLAVQAWDPEAVAWAEVVALSVPMHTAMRLGLAAARAVRSERPELPICLYGLYAAVSSERTVGPVADRVIAGEYEPELVSWVDALAEGSGRDAAEVTIAHGRSRFEVPVRELLPPLERYAHLAIGAEQRPVGGVEASHGCASRCRHCPLPTVYDGRFRAVGADIVLADVAHLVAAGARHITFADPDFLNGAQHSLRVVRAMHRRFPELTFDCTTKVELILRHRGIWPEVAASGCLFVVSALECVDDAVLARLDKGHTVADAAEAVALLRAHGIELRPSFLPFTPWTTVEDMVELVDFVAANDLVGNVDPVHYTIRLLLPEGSLLLDHPDLAPHLGPYDPERLSYTWTAVDPEVDRLQVELTALVEAGLAAGQAPGDLYLAVRAAVRRAAGLAPFPGGLLPAGSTEGRPRLTEPWFC